MLMEGWNKDQHDLEDCVLNFHLMAAILLRKQQVILRNQEFLIQLWRID